MESAPLSVQSVAIKLILICRPTEDRRLSQPRHCGKGVQPVSKAVYRSGFCEKPANHLQHKIADRGISRTTIRRANH